MAAAYPKSVINEIPKRNKRALKKTVQKAPKPAKQKKPKKNKAPTRNPILNPTLGPALPTPPASAPLPPASTDFQTLADLYEKIFGPQIGSTPQTSQSGESVLVVPGADDTGTGSNKGAILLIVIVLGAGGYYLYKKHKKAA